MLRAAAESLLSLVYPHECRVCGDLVDALISSTSCDKCWAEARLFSEREMLCSKCGLRLDEQASPKPVVCGKCGDFDFDKAVALGVYEGALAAAVIELKKTPFFDAQLSQLLKASAECQAIYFNADVIVPVPLSIIRRHERGFNQAEIIANEVSRRAGIAVDSLSLARTRHTPMHRVGMDSKARKIASLKAFVVTRKELIRDCRVLLVDDVMTSGATASACATALKKAGASQVNVFTLARAVMH
jgi:ComF family protein